MLEAVGSWDAEGRGGGHVRTQHKNMKLNVWSLSVLAFG